MKLTSSILRKAVEFHKTETKCVEAVAESPHGIRFLSAGDTGKPTENVMYFERCPVCGKEVIKEGAGYPERE
jgi:hypothetical protein